MLCRLDFCILWFNIRRCEREIRSKQFNRLGVLLKTSYVLITAARNEEKFVGALLRSVLSQTILPKKWIIVSDSSTDRTDEIVQKFAGRHDFIRLIRFESDCSRNFGSHAKAWNLGYKQLGNMEYDFIGNLDADITFKPDYYEKMLSRFDVNCKLGIAGGMIHELQHGRFKARLGNRTWSVSGALQLFRRECHEQVGCYQQQLQEGGYDTVAEVIARMKGWHVESFREVIALHHRHTGTAIKNIFHGKYRNGQKDYLIGAHPLYFIMKCFRRAVDRPYGVASLLMIIGYFGCFLRGRQIAVSSEIANYMRHEQLQRLRRLFITG